MRLYSVLPSVPIDFIHKYFRRFKSPYKLIKTSSSLRFQNDKFGFMVSGKPLGLPALIAMKNLKQEILKSIEGRVVERVESQYCGVNRDVMPEHKGELHNLQEVDLSSAYLYSALKQEFICEKTFHRIKHYSKGMRLRVLGAIAVRRRITEYFPDGRTVKTLETNEQLRNVWFSICKYVDDAIIKCREQLGNAFIFYWVDNLCHFAGQGKLVQDVLFSKGFLFKERSNVSLSYNKGHWLVLITMDDKRKFFISERNRT